MRPVVVVTGDSGTLGTAIVKELLSHDYTVIGISRRLTREIQELTSVFVDRYKHISFDLSQPEKIEDLYHSELKGLGPIYGLVNNAAYAYDEIVTNASIEEIERMFRVNVYSPIMLTKYVLRDMLLHDVAGSIVHVSSVSAHTGYRGLSMYAASKAAIEAFSKTVAREWGVRGIRSNCVAPGFMETHMSASLTEEQKKRIYQRTSLRIPTSVEDVAKLIRFLLSDESKSITGTTIHIDCGTL